MKYRTFFAPGGAGGVGAGGGGAGVGITPVVQEPGLRVGGLLKAYRPHSVVARLPRGSPFSHRLHAVHPAVASHEAQQAEAVVPSFFCRLRLPPPSMQMFSCGGAVHVGGADAAVPIANNPAARMMDDARPVDPTQRATAI